MSNEIVSAENNIIDGIKENAGLAVGVGVFLLVLGFLSICAPLVAGASLTIMVGITLILAGFVQCLLAFKSGIFSRGLLIFFIGVLTFMVGMYMVRQPVAALTSITFFLAIYFITTGIIEIIVAFKLKPADGWSSMFINALITFILGVMIWRQFPLSGIWAVGVLFGVKMMCTGGVLLSLGRAVKKYV